MKLADMMVYGGHRMTNLSDVVHSGTHQDAAEVRLNLFTEQQAFIQEQCFYFYSLLLNKMMTLYHLEL